MKSYAGTLVMDRRDEGSEDSPLRDDPGRHGRCAAIEGWVNDGHVDRNKDVLLRILKNLYSRTRCIEISITPALFKR